MIAGGRPPNGKQTMTLKVADSVKLDFDRSALGRIVRAPGDKEAGG